MMRVTGILGLAFAAAAFAPAAAAADLVCFSTTGRGATCLNGGKIEHHTRASARLPSDSFGALAACGDVIVATVGGSVVAYDGKAWSAPNRPPGGFAAKLACAEPGKYWVSTTGGVAYWDGGAWKSYKMAEAVPAAGTTIVFDIAAGPGGTAWVALANGVVALFEGGQWTVFKEGQGFDKRYPFTRLFADGKGQVWIPAGAAVLAFRDGRWQPVPGVTNFSAIAFGADGKRWIASGAKLVMHDGDRRAEYDLGHSIRGLAADAGGAVWVASEFGIARFADGKFETRHMHDSPLPDNDFSAVAVVGKGAALPPTAPQQPGSLEGRLEWNDGKPVAGAEIQICGVSAGIFTGPEGPCGKRPLFFQATANGEGKFQFPKTPPAAYRIAVKPVGAPRWIVFLGTTDRLRVGTGEAKNAGTLTMDTRNRPN